MKRDLSDGSQVAAYRADGRWWVGIRYPGESIHTDTTGPFWDEANAAQEVTARAAMRAEMLDSEDQT
jgi:hypothetical protein